MSDDILIINNPDPIILTVEPPEEVVVIVNPPEGVYAVIDDETPNVVEIVPGGGGASNLSELEDVDFSIAPEDDQVLTFDFATEKWEPKPAASSVSSLTDVDLTTPPSDGDVLTYEDSSDTWVPAPAASSMATLSDVSLIGIGDGVILAYDATAEVWRPQFSVDQRNFRGDWQSSTSTLLWSTDFVDPADMTLFVPQKFPAAISGNPTLFRSAMSSVPGANNNYQYAVRFDGIITASAASDQGCAWMFNKAAVLPDGAQILQAKALIQDRTAVAGLRCGLTPIAAQDVGVYTDTVGSFVELTLNGISDTFGFVIEDNLSGGSGLIASDHGWVAAVRVYGTPVGLDAYNIGDVVSHGGLYYRSLYDLNTETPGTGPKWLQIPSI